MCELCGPVAWAHQPSSRELEPAAHRLQRASAGARRARPASRSCARARGALAGEREQRRAREQHEGHERGDGVAGQAEHEGLRRAMPNDVGFPGRRATPSKWISTPSSASAAPTWSWTPTDMPPVITTTSAASSAAAIASRIDRRDRRARAPPRPSRRRRADERRQHVRARVAHARPGAAARSTADQLVAGRDDRDARPRARRASVRAPDRREHAELGGAESSAPARSTTSPARTSSPAWRTSWSCSTATSSSTVAVRAPRVLDADDRVGAGGHRRAGRDRAGLARSDRDAPPACPARDSPTTRSTRPGAAVGGAHARSRPSPSCRTRGRPGRRAHLLGEHAPERGLERDLARGRAPRPAASTAARASSNSNTAGLYWASGTATRNGRHVGVRSRDAPGRAAIARPGAMRYCDAHVAQSRRAGPPHPRRRRADRARGAQGGGRGPRRDHRRGPPRAPPRCPGCPRPPSTASRRSTTTCCCRAARATSACAPAPRASPRPATRTSTRCATGSGSSSASAATTARCRSPRRSASASATPRRRSATATSIDAGAGRDRRACSRARRRAAPEPEWRSLLAEPVLTAPGDWSGAASTRSPSSRPRACSTRSRRRTVRGRGGAGFPAGDKWGFTRGVAGRAEVHRRQRRRGRPRLLHRQVPDGAQPGAACSRAWRSPATPSAPRTASC